VWPEEGATHLPRKFLIFFHFKIVHSGLFSYTNNKFLFAIKRRERYVIMVFLATDSDTDIKTSGFLQSRKLRPVSYSLATRVGFTATVCMCCGPKIILYELQTHCRATIGPSCAAD